MSYRMILKGRYALFAPLLVLLLVAIACGDDATSVPATSVPATSVPATSVPATSVPATSVPGAPTATPQATTVPVVSTPAKLGKRLTVALNSFESEIMDPHVGGKGVGLLSFTHAQDFMMGIDVDNTLTNAWGWADSWEMVDGSTWDIDIRKGLMDHDGVEMTSEDGVWNVTRWASDEAATGYGATFGGWRNIFEDAEALDTHKFRINLVQDYAFVFNIIPPIGGSDMYVFPKHSWVDNGETAEGWEAAGFDGTGFVDMVGRKISVSTSFERFDDYYADEEFQFKYKEMEILLAAEDAPRLALVQTGVADIANMSGPFVEEIRAAGLTVDGPKAVDVVYMGLYQTYDQDLCTSKLNVRKAMNLAVDAEAIRQGIWPPGVVSPGIHSFTSPQDESWNPTLVPYGYDVEEAKRLLKQEGCDGFKFEAYGYDFAAGPEMADMVDAIVGYLVAVGIDAKFTPIDWATGQKKVKTERFGAADGPASAGAHWQLGGRNFADKIRVHGLCGRLGGSVCSLPDQEKWKTNYLAYAAIMDRDERVKVAQQMSKELYDLYVGVPIALRNAIWAIDPRTVCSEWNPIDGTPSHTMFNTLAPCESELE